MRIPAVGSSRSPRYRLRLLQRSFAVQCFWPEPPGRQVIPIEILAGPTILESNLKAPTPRDGFVFDDANAACVHNKPARLGAAGSLEPSSTPFGGPPRLD
jgi:hypothetical protein